MAACDLPPSDEAGYLIYCPTQEELEDDFIEDEDGFIWGGSGGDVMQDDKAGIQIAIRSMYQDGNANFTQGTISTNELPSKKASIGAQGPREANDGQVMQRALPNFPLKADFESEFEAPQRERIGIEYCSSQIPHHEPCFEGERVAEVEAIDSSSSHRSHGGIDRRGVVGVDICALNQSTFTCSGINCDSNKTYIEATRTGGEKPHRCSICNKGFHYKVHLERHMIIHTGDKPYPCSVCDKAFGQKYSLKKHMEIHAEVRTYDYQCSVCNKRYHEKSRLAVHMRTHTGERPYECLVCKKRFSEPRAFARHKLIHTGEKPHQCLVCSKAYTQRSSLVVHMASHAEEPQFECSVCNRGFNTKKYLTKHMMTHTGEKPYQCSVCNKKFSAWDALHRHKRIHTGEKPYQCSICNKRFSQWCSLARHGKIHAREKS